MTPKRQWDIEEVNERMDGIAEVAHKRSRHYTVCIASGLLVAGVVTGFGQMGPVRTESFANKNTILVRPFRRGLPRDEPVAVRRSQGEFQPDVDEGFSTARLARLGEGLFMPLDDDEIADLDIPL